MNLGGLLLLFMVMVAAVGGIYLISANTTPSYQITDTYGNMAGNATNSSQSEVQNLTSTGVSVGVGAVLLVVGIMFAVVLGGLILVATGKIF